MFGLLVARGGGGARKRLLDLAMGKAIGLIGFATLAALAVWAPEVLAAGRALFRYAADTYLMVHLDMESVRLACF